MSAVEMALNLSDRSTRLRVRRCQYCDGRIVWATSKRTGKAYPCSVIHSQSEDHWREQLRYAPWQPHRCAEATR